MTVCRLDAELWALGELSDERVAELDALRAADPELAGWMDGVRSAVVAAGDDMPTLSLPVETNKDPWWRHWWVPAAAFAGAAAVLTLTLSVPEPEAPSEVFRGAVDLEIHLVRDGAAAKQGSLIAAQEGDRLQLRVTPPRDGMLSIFDLQDDGVLTEWMPSRPVEGLRPVDFAVRLDDYAGSERVYVVFSDEPIVQEDLERALGRTFDRPLAELDVIPGLDATQRSILIYRNAP